MTQPHPGQKTCMVSARLPRCSVTKLCPILCLSMTCNMPGLLVLHYLLSLLRFLPVEMVMLSKLLILCHPLLLWPSIFPSIRVFSSEWALHIRWPKDWNFSFSISPSSEYSDWFALGWTGWISCSPRDSQESSPTPQFKNINSSVLSLLHSPTLTSIHDHWKNHNLWLDRLLLTK